MSSESPRIGVFGGTFDPPHVGHLALAEAARDQLELDDVIFLPASKNPLKSRRAIAEGHHRLSMVRTLINGKEGLAASDMELTRGGVSYTVDTLGELKMVQPADYWFIMGADSLRQITEWRNLVRLSKLCRLAIAIRPPMTEADVRIRIPVEFEDKCDLVSMPASEVSSTEVRDRLARNRPTAGLLTPEVAQYIHRHKLYL
jgi:nicotinate-nucleotide adenylyltransferase